MADWSLLLRPGPRQLLRALLAGPRTLSQLASEVGVSKPAALRHLRALVELGVATQSYHTTSVGREAVYELLGCSLRLDLAPASGIALAWATPGAPEPRFPLLSQVPQPDARAELATLLAAGLDRAPALARAGIVLFGSVARGEATWKSDVDLLLVLPDEAGPREEDAILDAMADGQPALRRAVRVHFARRGTFPRAGRRIEEEAAREGLLVHAPAQEVELWTRLSKYRHIAI